ncbi:response regulator [Caulobacter sp. KR2-114]|uniref:response regulator n=1 Tax=Caulobacter sp. KR2-114 TaxID=3400912 RepID=UPI003C07A404
MYNTDARTLQRMAPMMQRVVIIDPAPASARLLTDLLREICPCQVWQAPDAVRGMAVVGQVNPHIIFVEQNAAVDGAGFTRKLRRGDLACRRAPVIMVTSEATAAIILGARDAGVHEFLRKPYTAKDLMRRLEAVTLRSRDWVEAVNYVGPDRRRFNSGDYSGPLKRGSDTTTTPEGRIIQSLKILKAAVAAIDVDPKQALRAMLAQATELQAAAKTLGDVQLRAAAIQLHQKLGAANVQALNKADLQNSLADIWKLAPAEAGKGEEPRKDNAAAA